MKMKIRTLLIISYVLIILLFSFGIVFVINDYIINEVTSDHIHFSENGVKNLSKKNKELTEKYLLDLSKVFVNVSACDSSKIIAFLVEGIDFKNHKLLTHNHKLQEIIYEPIMLRERIIGYTCLVDENGVIVLHRDPRFQGKNIFQWKEQFPQMCQLIHDAIKKGQSSGYYRFWETGGTKIVSKYMAVSLVPKTDLYLCAYMNLGAIFEPINKEYHHEEQSHSKQVRFNIVKHAFVLAKEIQQASIGLIVLLSIICGVAAFWIAYRITIPITQLTKAVKKMGAGRFDAEVEVNGSREISELACTFNNLGKELVQYMDNLEKEVQAREALESELKIARNIQQSILQINSLHEPRPELELYATLYPAKEVAGDFYDFFYLDEQKRETLVVLVADVSGKGIYAAIFMAMAKTIIKNLCLQYPGDPAGVLKRANNLYNNSESMFVTMFLGFYKIKTGELFYANAGHHSAVHIDERKTLREFGVFNDAVLGLFPDNQYHYGTELFEAGDVLVLYTDGIIEAINKKKEAYGEARFQELVVEHCHKPLHEMCREMADCIREYEEGNRFDDITLLTLKRLQ